MGESGGGGGGQVVREKGGRVNRRMEEMVCLRKSVDK
jgi:hypothetical protein